MLELEALDGNIYLQGVEDPLNFINAVKQVEEGKCLDISKIESIRLKNRGDDQNG